MNESSFQIFDVTAWRGIEDEPVGSKKKQWLRRGERADDPKRWLFKWNRTEATGEGWAEKVTFEIACFIGLPCPHVDLAERDKERGCLVLDFTDNGKKGSLVLGNELLISLDPSYPRERGYRVPDHTVEAIRGVLDRDIGLPDDLDSRHDITSAFDLFVGYLAFDALIGNTDRHHENWGILQGEKGKFLAPSFDHASSLGQILTDEERRRRLSTTDSRQSILAYLERGKSALYDSNKTQLKILEAFQEAGKHAPSAAQYWIRQIGDLKESDITSLLQRVPDEAMSQLARDFAAQFLLRSRERIFQLYRPGGGHG